MFRTCLAATALVLHTGAAFADTHAMVGLDKDNMVPVSRLVEGDVYAVSRDGDEWAADTAFDSIGPDWEEAGEIEEIVLDRNGQMAGIIVEIGGFLGIGDKSVFLPTENVRLVMGADADDEWIYVTRYSEEELEALEEVDDDWWDD